MTLAESEPSTTMSRASHSGTAMSSSGGTTKLISRCCTMCTEYRYSSAMSCMGQSADTHSRATPTMKHSRWRLVTAATPGATATGATTRTT